MSFFVIMLFERREEEKKERKRREGERGIPGTRKPACSLAGKCQFPTAHFVVWILVLGNFFETSLLEICSYYLNVNGRMKRIRKERVG